MKDLAKTVIILELVTVVALVIGGIGHADLVTVFVGAIGWLLLASQNIRALRS